MPLSTTWGSRMPVRVRIHSSLVSTIFSRSALVITRGGTYPATPVIFAARRRDIVLLARETGGAQKCDCMRCQEELTSATQRTANAIPREEFRSARRV